MFIAGSSKVIFAPEEAKCGSAIVEPTSRSSGARIQIQVWAINILLLWSKTRSVIHINSVSMVMRYLTNHRLAYHRGKGTVRSNQIHRQAEQIVL